MDFCDEHALEKMFKGKTVAIVGGGPSTLKNEPGYIDSHEVVVRVNNYKLFGDITGKKTDVFYSYFGGAIKKTKNELQRDGVSLCIAKCPNCQFIDSEWHRRNNKMIGVDFRYIYQKRAGFWFCKTYVTPLESFMEMFELLGKHIPTTGFSAIYEILKHNPKKLYITGFDFFESNVHNVNEAWKKLNPDDPIRHMPELEREWVLNNVSNYPIELDRKLSLIKRRKETE